MYNGRDSAYRGSQCMIDSIVIASSERWMSVVENNAAITAIRRTNYNATLYCVHVIQTDTLDYVACMFRVHEPKVNRDTIKNVVLSHGYMKF